MPAPTTYPSGKQFIGLAKETTPGTPVAMTVTLPVDTFEPEDKVTGLLDKANRGSMVTNYSYVQGVKHTEFSIKGPAFMDTLPYLVNNILGDITTTGATPPYSHAISVLNSGTAQPGTLTITDWQGLPATTFARQYTGCCLSELTITGNAESELIMFDAKGMGWPSNIAASAPTSAPSTALPIASWRSTVTIGGSADATVGDWEIKITRALKQIFTAQNSQNPYITQRGEVTGSYKLTFSAPAGESNALLTLLNNTQPTLALSVSNGGSGSGLLSLATTSTVAAFDTSKIDRGAEQVAYSATVNPMANTTDAGASGGYSPFKITFQNAITSGSY